MRKNCISCGKERDGDNPLWCIECNKERMKLVDAQMKRIEQLIKEGKYDSRN